MCAFGSITKRKKDPERKDKSLIFNGEYRRYDIIKRLNHIKIGQFKSIIHHYNNFTEYDEYMMHEDLYYRLVCVSVNGKIRFEYEHTFKDNGNLTHNVPVYFKKNRFVIKLDKSYVSKKRNTWFISIFDKSTHVDEIVHVQIPPEYQDRFIKEPYPNEFRGFYYSKLPVDIMVIDGVYLKLLILNNEVFYVCKVKSSLYIYKLVESTSNTTKQLLLVNHIPRKV